ncbi:MAG: hypothetical protein R3F54_32325, partial [Alphaproteobacteria bacterium]
MPTMMERGRSVSLIAAAGFLLSLGLGWFVYTNDLRDQRAEVDRAVSAHLATIDSQVQWHVQTLDALHALYDASQAVDADEFLVFSRRWLPSSAALAAASPPIRALGWIPAGDNSRDPAIILSSRDGRPTTSWDRLDSRPFDARLPVDLASGEGAADRALHVRLGKSLVGGTTPESASTVTFFSPVRHTAPANHAAAVRGHLFAVIDIAALLSADKLNDDLLLRGSYQDSGYEISVIDTSSGPEQGGQIEFYRQERIALGDHHLALQFFVAPDVLRPA